MKLSFLVLFCGFIALCSSSAAPKHDHKDDEDKDQKKTFLIGVEGLDIKCEHHQMVAK